MSPITTMVPARIGSSTARLCPDESHSGTWGHWPPPGGVDGAGPDGAVLDASLGEGLVEAGVAVLLDEVSATAGAVVSLRGD